MINSFENNKYEIVVVGAGIVGGVQSLLLAQAGFKVLLLDATKKTESNFFDKLNNLNHTLPPDVRMSAVTLRAEEILNQTGVLDNVSNRFGLVKNIHVWDSSGPGEVTFEALSIGKNYLCKLIENNLLQEAINHNLLNYPNVTIIRPSQISSIENNEIRENGHIYAFDLLIGSDGAHSWVRNHLNFACDSQSYNHNALVTTVYTNNTHNNTAYQQFLETGVIAFLPWRQENAYSIVWSQSPEDADYWLNCDKAVFIEKINSYIPKKTGQIINCDSRFAFPLTMRHVKNYYKDSCVLVGDAAHTIHPLAGQGLNLGIYDAYALANALIWGKNNQYSLDSPCVLKKYELNRRGHNQAMLDLMGVFKKLYSHPNTAVKMFRNLGMNMLDLLPQFKKIITRQAAGYL